MLDRIKRFIIRTVKDWLETQPQPEPVKQKITYQMLVEFSKDLDLSDIQEDIKLAKIKFVQELLK